MNGGGVQCEKRAAGFHLSSHYLGRLSKMAIIT